MAANLEDQLINKVRALPPNKQQEALRLLESLATSPSSEGTGVDRTRLAGRRRNQRWLTRRHLGERAGPTARSILVAISTERRSGSRDNVPTNKMFART